MSEIVGLDVGDEIIIIQGRLKSTLKVIKVEEAEDV